MRKTLYAVSGTLMGAILFIFLFTEIPEINKGETDSKFLKTDEELVGLSSDQSFSPFFPNGTYHIDKVEAAEMGKKGVINYGKNNPMFFYTHVEVPEETGAFNNCTELNAVHPNGVPEGDPSYSPSLDRDNDGWACESSSNGEPASKITANGDVPLSDPNSKGGTMIVKGDSILYDGFDLETRTYKQVEISEALFDFSVSGVIPIREENYHISSPFGLRKDPFEKVEAMHTGTDFSAEKINSSDVYSVNHGKVEKIVKGTAGYGNYVVINHNGYSSLYAHLESFAEMEEGDFVRAGAVIGKVGNTGRSTGPHLHFEIRIGEITVDPEIFLNKVRGAEK